MKLRHRQALIAQKKTPKFQYLIKYCYKDIRSRPCDGVFLFKIKLQHKQLNNQPELKPETLQSFCIAYEDNFRSVSSFYYCWLLCNCRLYAFWICCCSIFQFYQTHLVLNEIQ